MADLTVLTVRAPNPGPMTLEGTNTMLVGDATGCVVIDPGCDDAAHLAEVVAQGAHLGGISAIIVTHGHMDHRGGATDLAALAGAPIFAAMPTPDGVPEASQALAEGSTISAGQHTLTVMLTPGHRFDHCCLWHAPSGDLFAGDLMAGRGTVVIASPEGEMAAYLASLRRIQALPVRLIWPGHGPVITDPADRIAYYIAHRLEREAQVVTALIDAASPQTLAALVPIVYRDTPPAMYAWAARSLQAHLLKLAAEGRVVPLGPLPDGPWQLLTGN